MKSDVALEGGEKVASGSPLIRNGHVPALAVSISSELHEDVVANNITLSPRSVVSNSPSITHLNVPNGNAKHHLTLPTTAHLIVPSSQTTSTVIGQPPPSPSPASPSKSVAVAAAQPAPSARSKSPSSSGAAAPSNALPLGLKEVTKNCDKEYLKQLFRIIKINLLVLFIGSLFALTGIGMMTYSALKILNVLYNDHPMVADDDLHATSLEEIFERLGAVLGGIGAFINMVSVVFILDRRALLYRERNEKIETFKKNRQQPRNLFEILLANAKSRRDASAALQPQESSAVGGAAPDQPPVVITEPQSDAIPEVVVATGSVKSASVKGEPIHAAGNNAVFSLTVRRPSISSGVTAASNVRQRLGSNSMAKAMAAVTSHQLKQFSKAKGADVEVFVVSHPVPSVHRGTDSSRPPSRTSLSSSQRRRNQSLLNLPENALQIHRSLEEWLKSSLQHTATNEFATEDQSDAESATMSISIASDSVSERGKSRSPSPEPTLLNIADPSSAVVTANLPVKPTPSVVSRRKHDKSRAKKIKSSAAVSRTLPGSNVPINNVFRQMYTAQKTGTFALYDTDRTERETPLPPPVRVSAHYARRQQMLQQQQQQQPKQENKQANKLYESSPSPLAVPMSTAGQYEPKIMNPSSSPVMWTTDASTSVVTIKRLANNNNNNNNNGLNLNVQSSINSRKIVDPYRIDQEQQQQQLPPLPATSTRPTTIMTQRPPLPRQSSSNRLLTADPATPGATRRITAAVNNVKL